jgi:hypothetical protein
MDSRLSMASAVVADRPVVTLLGKLPRRRLGIPTHRGTARSRHSRGLRKCKSILQISPCMYEFARGKIEIRGGDCVTGMRPQWTPRAYGSTIEHRYTVNSLDVGPLREDLRLGSRKFWRTLRHAPGMTGRLHFSTALAGPIASLIFRSGTENEM